MKTSIVLTPLLAGAVALLAGCATPRNAMSPRDVVTQVSTYDALYHALYDGVMPLSEVKSCGDMGVGTLEGFNGELILLDGRFYDVAGNGRVEPITDLSATVPFIELTFFDDDMDKDLPAGTTYTDLRQAPLNYLPTRNIIYAVKIEGTFRHVKTRSMPKQTKPYPAMTELMKTQPTFEFNNVRGTILGFWSPSSMQGVSPAGWHLHFLTADHNGGGHVLEFSTRDAVLELDESREFRWLIPGSEEFRQADFGKE